MKISEILDFFSNNNSIKVDKLAVAQSMLILWLEFPTVLYDDAIGILIVFAGDIFKPVEICITRKTTAIKKAAFWLQWEELEIDLPPEKKALTI